MNARFGFGRRGVIAAVAPVILGQLPSSDLARAQEEAFPSKTIEVVGCGSSKAQSWSYSSPSP